jgi:hypothetical protein
MGGKLGTKETQDLLYLVKVSTLVVLREVMKDGFQPQDLGAVLKSPEFEAALKEAMANVTQVPAELTELDLFDDLALGRYVYGMVTDIVAELKAAKAKKA